MSRKKARLSKVTVVDGNLRLECDFPYAWDDGSETYETRVVKTPGTDTLVIPDGIEEASLWACKNIPIGEVYFPKSISDASCFESGK